MLDSLIRTSEIVVLVYFVALNGIYTVFTVMAFFHLMAYRRRLWRGDLRLLMSEASYRPISIVVPAHNEQETIIATVRSLLALKYPEYEIVIVSDGSTDATLERLRENFALYAAPAATRAQLPSKRVLGSYRSLDHPNLVVVDKENGGKADALNAGINATSFPLFCCIDADSILESDALLRAARAFAQDDRVVAAGGIIRVLNGSTVEEGQVVEHRTPNRPIVLCQAVEYVRGFLTGRGPLARMNALLIISGAFGLFRKDAVIEAGGYRTDTVCEDMEIIVRLQRWGRENDRPAKVIFLPDPVCWTQVPSDWRSLLVQRDRWQRGLLESLWMHRGAFLNPKYGALGLLAMPYYVLFEALGPIIELFGYLLILVLWITGRLDPGIALLFFTFAMLFGIVLSILSLVLDDLLFKRYDRARDFAKMILASFLEYFGYRQFLALQRTLSYINFVLGRRGWGKATRHHIPHTDAAEAA